MRDKVELVGTCAQLILNGDEYVDRISSGVVEFFVDVEVLKRVNPAEA